jgi:sporadic carbohydrate cluster protein (TIGR04323 family)
MSERSGWRGYIGSRPLRGTSYPQRLQNLAVRDYASSRGLAYKLSATEYAMPGCYMIFEDVLAELPRLEGIILFSTFLLPERSERRAAVYERVLAAGASLHAALEQLAIRTPDDVARFEDVIAVANALPAAPLGGRYEKTARQDAADSFTAILRG